MTDGQLIANYLAGEAGAFEDLHSRYRRQLYAYLNRMLPANRAAVDDIYQQTWLKIIDNLPKYRDENRFISYLFRIARNQAIDHIRRGKYEVAVDDQRLDILGEFVEPAAEVENRELAAAISQAVDSLPLEQREVFAMRQQGIAFKDIAAAQRASINTVLGRMRYALENLRKKLTEAGVTP